MENFRETFHTIKCRCSKYQQTDCIFRFRIFLEPCIHKCHKKSLFLRSNLFPWTIRNRIFSAISLYSAKCFQASNLCALYPLYELTEHPNKFFDTCLIFAHSSKVSEVFSSRQKDFLIQPVPESKRLCCLEPHSSGI